MMENANSPKSKVQFNRITYQPQRHNQNLLKQIDRNHHRSSVDAKILTQRKSPAHTSHNRVIASTQNIFSNLFSSQKRVQRQQSPMAKFNKAPTVQKLNYDFVITWYEKIALESLLNPGSIKSIELSPRDNNFIKRI